MGTSGRKGATEETIGDPLADNWETPTKGAIVPSDRVYRISNFGGTEHYGLISERVSRQVMMVQGRVYCGHSKVDVGIRARGRHTAGGDDDPTEGWPAYLNHGDQRFRGQTYIFDLSTWHTMQAYVEDSLQEYAVRGPNGADREVSILRDSNTDATYNGLTRSFGFYCEGNVPTGTNKSGFCDHIACFASNLLTIGSAPSGGRAEVFNAAGDVVASASESGGSILVNLSMYGNGTTGCTEPVPLPGGFPRVVVYDSLDAVVVDAGGAFYPGGEFDVSGSDLVVREDSSGAEPIPVIGLLHYSVFDEISPGPEIGDGGDGAEPDETAWTTATGTGEDGVFGGGGGAGAELSIAGQGGSGGAGDGAYSTNTPGDGEANTGGGGGGSGDASVAGGDGGSGIVIVRAQRFPDSVPEASRFSDSAVDQTNDGGIILAPNTDEVLSFGDVTAWNGLGAFTIVLRHEPDFLNSQRYAFSRFSTSGSLRRQLAIFQRNPGTDFGVLLSQGGADYAALWRTSGWSTNDYMYAVVFDGSLTGGGNNKNRLKLYRDINDGNGFTELAWSFEFYDGRSDVPSQLMSTTGLPELYGDRDDGAGDSSPGVGRLLAIRYGEAYSIAELDAMDLWDKPNIDPLDWDRLYRFEGHVADEAGSTDGFFDTPR